jgi:hypothetical protein
LGGIGGTNSEEASMMNDARTPIGQPAAVTPPGKLAYATPSTAPLVAGRRSFFKYRDLGVTAASSGKIRAQVTIAGAHPRPAKLAGADKRHLYVFRFYCFSNTMTWLIS